MNFDPNKFLEYLPYMAKGMLGIGAVIGVIVLVTVILNAATKEKTE